MESRITILPQYGEVDQMGYVYHANYVNYCHKARTELLREIGISDAFLEDKGYMLPVIEMDMKYTKPAYYDQELTVHVRIAKPPSNRLVFDYIFENHNKELVCRASSTVVFVNKDDRKPCRMPKCAREAFEKRGQQTDNDNLELLVAYI